MKRGLEIRIKILLVCIIYAFFTSGCEDKGKSSVSSTAVPPVEINLNGYIIVPGLINDKLLANISGARSTDSTVRDSFSRGTVYVNGEAVSNSEIVTSVYPWEIRMRNVPQNEAGLYRVEFSSGKVGLKAMVRETQKDSFYMDTRSTAAFLLSDAAGIRADEIIATFPSVLTPVAKSIEDLFNTENSGFENIFQLPTLQDEIERQRRFLDQNRAVNTKNKVSFLSYENDLDGDGTNDFFVKPTTDGTRMRFECALSNHSSMMDQISSIDEYTDSHLLKDFEENNLIATRTFGIETSNFALGFFFKKSLKSDLYLKLFVKNIESAEGSFKGINIEYSFITATGTALASGSKTFLRLGSDLATGTIASTDFINDNSMSDQTLVYLDRSLGLGSSDGKTAMIMALPGKPDLLDIESALDHTRYPYFSSMTRATQEITRQRQFEMGDVFLIHFPKTDHYAKIKVTSVNEWAITVDYVVNTAKGELELKMYF
ncbi:MAG: hypothetical protein HQM10_04095 [Candidatus Riflebacteria bacterium]|nr:hypothetical protein [Candidatus Riflebacteria bacterium]